MKTYTIKSETADLIRQAAPALGLVANGAREIVGPGMEALHLAPFAAVKFESLIKSGKVSADTVARRLLAPIIKKMGV